MSATYDCLIVGARCAGAPLARFLAKGGARVLVVDAGTFPSDQPLSTHFIQPYGMRILDELGLGDKVRDIAPPVTLFVNGIGEHLARIHIDYGGCCPRRTDLDALLVEGAREAGAEVRLRTRLVELLRDGDRVVGAVVEDDAGRHDIRARVVVGADGRNSKVAELTGAEEYYAYDGERGAYWAYWPRPSWYADDPRYQGGAFIVYDDLDMRVVFPTNRDQLLIGVVCPKGEVDEYRKDPRAHLQSKLASHPITGPLVEAEPLGKIIGLVQLHYFFRRAAGPGWALVGDAGLHKDPSPGFGITDSLRDARALSQAILAGGDDAAAGGEMDVALERYWRERDVASVELYHFAKDLGLLRYNNALNQLVFQKLAVREDLHPRIVDVIERRVSPFEAIGVGTILRWTLGALLRGRFSVLRPFFAAGKYGGMVKKELKLRRRLAA
ncbi:MAG TPA: NAD(P)/FAD-dependent oxidoreductase [Kofleriaceae bacterium]|nr:NAD(P)/FAD-dependent oxidoreductase [Kofleriaceae bacterium]